MSVIVSGGTVSSDGAYTIHTFEESGTLTVSGGTLANVQYLLVAGGGEAAFGTTTYISGGGAGGIHSGDITLDSGAYPVVIGAAGNNSSFLDMVSMGGGQGGFYGNGLSGGSGGGGAVFGTVHIRFENFVGGDGTPGQGFQGGAPGGGGYPPCGPGGGGGAVSPGGKGSQDGVGGPGGHGFPSTITGELVYYAGGGSGKGPNGIGTNSQGYTGYGAGGGYDLSESNYCNRLSAQPGVLIIRYETP